MGAFALIDSGGQGITIGMTSRALLRLPHLPLLLGLGAARLAHARRRGGFDLYVGWGGRRSGRAARDLAARDNAPFLLLEDGFLRSVAPGRGAAPALSLVADDRGVHYQADTPSRLEALVADCVADAALTARADRLIAALRAARISKYNDHDDAAGRAVLAAIPERPVLVVDQAAGDVSIAGAGADPGDFRRMLEAAFDEAEGTGVVVKCHPETVSGAKKGHLAALARRWGATVVDRPVNPWLLLERAGAVYTVSSQLGLEALMADVPVRCFGTAFYAGWGLTRDERACRRRAGVRPSPAALVAASHLAYSRYLDPFGPSLGTAEETIRLLSLWREQHAADRDLGEFAGVAAWKRRTVARAFPGARRARFHASRSVALMAARRSGRALVCWGGRADAALQAKARRRGVALCRIEDGFLRSVGLGAECHQPLSLVIDRRGIHYDAGRPSDLEALLNETDFDAALLARAGELIRRLTAHRLTKYSPAAGAVRLPDPPSDRPVILVPGQVDSDASLRHGAPGGQGMEAMLAAVRAAEPDAFIVFKPHPDVVAGHRRGLSDPARILAHADAVAPDAAIADLIAACDAVHALTSLTGFEALLRGKPVTCHGLPFYAGWGLTRDRLACPRRTRRLTLEALVAGALIVYPRYIDPVTGLTCPPEIAVSRLLERRQAVAAGAGEPLIVRLRRLQGRVRLGLGGTGW